MRTVSLSQACQQLDELVTEALRGEDVVLEREGVPAVRLVPVTMQGLGREGGWLRGRARVIDPDWEQPDPALQRLFEESVVLPAGEQEP
jgi:antitoxin (DNA-binding transcriptional repressor) of toxin-antitoxin stability system